MIAHLLSLSIAVCFVLGISTHMEAAQLIFKQPSVVVEVPIDGQEASVRVPFKNSSQAAVEILEVRTECDCVQASVTPPAIGAGKTGEVAIKFHSRLRNGTDLVRVKVVTDTDGIHEISVNAKLRSYIEVSPLTLHWMKGEKRELKEFLVSATGVGKLHFSKVKAMKDSKVEVIPDGKEPESIHVVVTPPAGNRPFQDVLLVSATLDGTNETKLYDLHVRAD